MKKYILTILLLFICQNIYADTDGQVTGGISNTRLGNLAGNNLLTASAFNNSFFGNMVGQATTIGDNNSFFGFASGHKNIDGNANTMIGTRAGNNNVSGSGNVFLGYRSGFYETGSNKLYIDNSDTSSPLLLGDFSSNLLTINGDLKYTGTLLNASGQDVIENLNTNINNETNNRINNDILLNDKIESTNNRVNKLEEIQSVVGAEVRVYDGRKFTVTTFVDYSSTRRTVDRAGLRVTFKVGKSYEEQRIDELEAKINRITKDKPNHYDFYTHGSVIGIKQTF